MKYLLVKCRFLMAVLSMAFFSQVAVAQASVKFTAPPDATGNYQWSSYDGVSGSYISIVGATSSTYTTTVSGLFQVAYTSPSFPTTANGATSGIYYSAPNNSYPVVLDGSAGNPTGPFQWLISTDGITYTNISGANSNIYNITSNTAIAYYELVVTTTGISTSAPYFIAPINPSIVMPVTLTSFTAAANNNCQVELAWASATESNSSKYVVQYSGDGGKIYTDIGDVTSKNSIIGASYSYTVNRTDNGTAFFRLKMVDKDASVKYSDTRVVAIACATTNVTVSPNPFKGYININGMGGANNTIRIYSFTGQLLVTKTTSNTVESIDGSNYPSGNYLVVVTNAGGKKIASVHVVK